MCFAPQQGTLFRDLNFQKWSENGVFCKFWLGHVLRANTVHFFDISTSKSRPRMVCFVHFDSKMCFAPLQRPLFRHLNFQKWSENGVLCTFWLRNVIRGTTTCTFLTSELPKVVREWCALYILTWKRASRHSCVHFFDISSAKSGPKLTFSSLIWPDGSAPTALQIIGKTQWFPAFLLFRAPASSFFWLFLFSDLLSSSLLFSDSSHLCFSICPYCRKFHF